MSAIGDTIVLRFGAPTSCADGPCGELTRVVVDPAARVVTHLVIGPHHRDGLGRLVPIGLAETRTDGIVLDTTSARLADLPYAEEAEILPDDPWAIAGYPSAGTLAWPTAPPMPAMILRERLPDDEVSLGSGRHLHAADGPVGRLRGVVATPDGRVTHVLLREGHLRGAKEVLVPLGAGDRVDEDGVHVALTRHAISGLPGTVTPEGRAASPRPPRRRGR